MSKAPAARSQFPVLRNPACHNAIACLRLVCLFLLLASARITLADDSDPSTARLYLRYDAPARRVRISVTAEGEHVFTQSRRAMEANLEKAITSGFGGDAATVTSMERIDEEGQPTQIDSEVVGWKATLALRKSAPHAFGGTPMRMTGTFDPGALQKYLTQQKIIFDEILVGVPSRGASTVRCDGVAPQERRGSRALYLDRDDTEYFESDLAKGQAAPVLRFTVGFSSPEVFFRILVPVLFLLLSLAAFAIHTRAILVRACSAKESGRVTGHSAMAEDISQIWFSYYRTLNGGTLAFCYAWICLAAAMRPAAFVIWLLNPASNAACVAISAAIYLLPPIGVLVACNALTVPVFLALHERRLKMRKVVMESAGRLLAGYLALAFAVIALAAFVDANDRVVRATPALRAIYLSRTHTWDALGWFALIGATNQFFTSLIFFYGTTKIVAIKDGALYDRVMELAKTAGVKVREVWFQSTGEQRMANAFALKGNSVMFTDSLLRSMSREEVDGVVAHELAHLKRRHARTRQLALGIASAPVGGLIGAGIVRPSLVEHVGRSPWYLGVVLIAQPLAFLIAYAISLSVSRKHEKEADLDAVKLTGQPAALIAGLERLGLLSGYPRTWTPLQQWLLTHPSAESRARYIAAENDLSDEALKAVLEDVSASSLEESLNAREHYALPTTGNFDDLVFSPQAYTRIDMIRFWSLPASLILVEACIRFVLKSLPSVGTNVIFIVLQMAALATVFISSAVLGRLLTNRNFRALKVPLYQKLIDGKSASWFSTAAEPLYVGLSPGAAARRFGHSENWTMGFLSLDADQLKFRGEKIDVTIPRKQITKIANAAPWPGWPSRVRTVVQWNSGGFEADVLTSVTLDRVDDEGRLAAGGATTKLTTRLLAWLHDSSTPVDPDALVETLAPVRAPEEKGQSPAQFGTRAHFSQVFRAYASVLLAFDILSNQRLVTIGATLLLLAILFLLWIWPYRHYRDAVS